MPAWSKTRAAASPARPYAKSNLVIVGGEITTKAKLDHNAIVRRAIRDIGYVNNDDVFHADKVFVTNVITSQSPDIAQGWMRGPPKARTRTEQGAGDQGLMFGFACDETPELMPAPIMFAHRLGRELTAVRKSGKVKWLRPDAKTQVSVQYENSRPVCITAVVVSTQHTAEVKHKTIRDFIIREVIKKVLLWRRCWIGKRNTSSTQPGVSSWADRKGTRV